MDATGMAELAAQAASLEESNAASSTSSSSSSSMKAATTTAPPQSAFRSLPLMVVTQTKHNKRRRSNSNSKKHSSKHSHHHHHDAVRPRAEASVRTMNDSLTDLFEQLEDKMMDRLSTKRVVLPHDEEEKDSPCSCSEQAKTPEHPTTTTSKILLDSLHANLSRQVSKEELSYYQACLASLLVVLIRGQRSNGSGDSGSPAPNETVVVEGLWAQVILPRLGGGEKKDGAFILELAREAWRVLCDRLGYLQVDPKTQAVSMAHPVYEEYGRALANEFDSRNQWREDYIAWLQRVYFQYTAADDSQQQSQSAAITAFAAKTLIPTLLQQQQYELASSVLQAPDYVTRLEQILLRLEGENLCHLTQRYAVDTVQRYWHLSRRPKVESTDTRPSKNDEEDELWTLYQSWNALLQRHAASLEGFWSIPHLDGNVSSCSGGSSSDVGSLSSTTSSQRRLERRQRREQRHRQRRQKRHQKQEKERVQVLVQDIFKDQPWTSLLVLGRSFHILAGSMMEIGAKNDLLVKSVEHATTRTRTRWCHFQANCFAKALEIYAMVLATPHEDDDDETGHDDKNVEDTCTLRFVATLLCADSWLSMSQCLGVLQDEDTPYDSMRLVFLTSLFAASLSSKKDTTCHLDASDPHSYGLQMAMSLLLEQENVCTAKTEALRASRALCLFRDTLFGNVHEAMGRMLFDRNQADTAIEYLNEAVRRKRAVLDRLKGIGTDAMGPESGGSWLLFWPDSVPAPRDKKYLEVEDDLSKKLGLQPPGDSQEQRLERAELSLAESLELSGLVMHARGYTTPALSALQQALLLKMSHLGKLHVEGARLYSVMASIHDDVLQWEAGLSCRRECLEICIHLSSLLSPQQWVANHNSLFQTMLETLRAMGCTYRILEVYDRSMSCYWKIAAMSRKQWEILREDPKEQQCTDFYGFSAACEDRLGEELRGICAPTLLLDELRYEHALSESSDCGPVWNTAHRNDGCDPSSQETSILREVAQSYQAIISLFHDRESASRMKQVTESSKSLADANSQQDSKVLLAASYHLGVIHMYFGEYQSAMFTLQYSLQSLWALEPSSSDGSGTDSYSDEEHVKKRVATRKDVMQKRDHPGICSGIGKTVNVVHQERVYHAAGLCRAACGEYDQAIRFHLTALRFARRRHGVDSDTVSKILNDIAICYWQIHEYTKALEFWSSCHEIQKSHVLLQKDAVLEEQDVPEVHKMEHAATLCNIGAALCAQGPLFSDTALSFLQEAATIFEVCGPSSLELANCLFYTSLALYHCAGTDMDRLRDAFGPLRKAIEIFKGLGYLSWVSGGDGSELDAHLFTLQAMILNGMGKVDEALSCFQTAYGHYVRGGVASHLHTACVLDSIGEIYKSRNESSEALRCFKEALYLRQERLGRGDHQVVGATLAKLGDILSGDPYVAYAEAMEMYGEARRILIDTEGSNSGHVANVLFRMGVLQTRLGLFDRALESFRGALQIRQHRCRMNCHATRANVVTIRLALKKSADDDCTFEEDLRKRFNEEIQKEQTEMAIVLHCMGTVHRLLRDSPGAIHCFEESIRAWRGLAISDCECIHVENASHVITLADTLHCLGCVHASCRQYERALECLSESLRLKQKYEAPRQEDSNTISIEPDSVASNSIVRHGDSMTCAVTLRRIGMVHARMQNRDLAMTFFQSALAIQRRHFAESDETIGQTLADMGRTLHWTKARRGEALQYYAEALTIRKRHSGLSSDVGDLLYRIGSLFDLDRSQRARSVAYYKQAVRIYGRQYMRSLYQRFCQSMLLPHNTAVPCENVDFECCGHDVFQRDATIQSPIEERGRAQQEYFFKVCSTLRRASTTTRQDNLASSETILLDLDMAHPDCCVNLELYLYGLLEFFNLVAGEWRHAAQLSLRNGLRQLDQQAQQEDSTLFRMLYLIPE